MRKLFAPLLGGMASIALAVVLTCHSQKSMADGGPADGLTTRRHGPDRPPRGPRPRHCRLRGPVLGPAGGALQPQPLPLLLSVYLASETREQYSHIESYTY
jgi:hypothetical protein